MSYHEENIKHIESIVSKIGEDDFKKALDELFKRKSYSKKASCNHDWKLSQIAGDGYNCFKCGSWKTEDDDFPKPTYLERDGEPCGECHIMIGERCDICGLRRDA